jgi:pimeloyl-ACP methyl ester carboxylesterase
LAFFPTRIDSAAVQPLPEGVREVFITTPDRQCLQCFLIRGDRNARALIYFHGNAGTIYDRLPELLRLSHAGLDVLGVGYRGYGKSTGRPSERGLYRDGEAALAFAHDTLGFAADKVFVMGRSIGTTVATYVAERRAPAGVILVTPFTTGREYAAVHGLSSVAFLAGSAFDNVSRCRRIASPVLVIHGRDDEVVPFAMGARVHELLTCSKRLVDIPGAHHNDLEYINPRAYWGAIDEFVAGESR